MDDVGNVDFEKCVILYVRIQPRKLLPVLLLVKKESRNKVCVYIVRKRLKLLGEDEDWFYHSSNECYMRYTNENAVAMIERRRQSTDASAQSSEPCKTIFMFENIIQLLWVSLQRSTESFF